MRTPITYYGGKQRLAKKIVSMLPPHKIYCEPFFGGGAVYFEKPKSKVEIINDIDNRLINFYIQSQNNFEELQRLIRNTLHSETMYLHAKDIWNERIESSDLQKAWAIWLITNGSFAGSMHGGWKWCNGSSGSHSAIMVHNKRLEFAEQLHIRLSETQISCRDAIRVILERDSPLTVFYLDPPYPGSYQGHYRGYTHKDLFELLSVLSRIQGKFILSQYFTHTLKYHVMKYGWNFRTEELDLRLTHLGKSRTEKRTEILVYNYEIQKTLFSI